MSNAHDFASSFKAWILKAIGLFSVDFDDLSIEGEVVEDHVAMFVSASPTDTSRVIGKDAEIVKAFRHVMDAAAEREGLKGSVQVNENRGTIRRFAKFNGSVDWRRQEVKESIAEAYRQAWGVKPSLTEVKIDVFPIWRAHLGVTIPDEVPDSDADSKAMAAHREIRKIYNVVGKTRGMNIFIYANRTGKFVIDRV